MYKHFIVFLLTMLMVRIVIGQNQDSVSSEQWIKFETSVTGDFIKNFQGGIKTNFVYIGMEELGISLDMEALGWWKGGEFYFHGLNSHGGSPSADIVGDLQVSSNIEAGDYVGFYEFYYQQTLGNFSFLIGQHDLNAEFVGTEYGGTFINSSFGISPTMSLNIPVSIYPTAGPAFISKYQNPKGHIVKLGVYDGDPGDTESNRYNLQPNINTAEGLLIIGEYEFSYSINNLPESYKVGLYYHTGDFTDYSDTNTTVNYNFGAYMVTDIVLWSGFNHPDSYLGLFIQGGYAPVYINQVDYYIGAGVHLNGILPQRYGDAIGLGFAYAHMGSKIRALDNSLDWGEIAYELTYKIRIFDNYTIQPNLQYISNPGANKSLSDALVGSVRFNISLEN